MTKLAGRNECFFSRVAILVIILGTAAAALRIIAFVGWELKNRNVEIIMDYNQVLAIAEQEGKTVTETLSDLSNYGATGVGLHEATLGALADRGELGILAGSDIISLASAGAPIAPELRALLETGSIRPEHTYLLLKDRESSDWILARARARNIRASLMGSFSPRNLYVVKLEAPFAFVRDLAIGFWHRDVSMISSAGVALVPRYSNPLLMSPSVIKDAFEILRQAKLVGPVVFDGREAMGNPKLLDVAANEIKSRGLAVGLIMGSSGAIKQAGLSELIKLRTDAIRVYSLPTNREELTVPAIVQQIEMAVKVKGARVIYLNYNFTKESAISVLKQAKTRLESAGYKIKPAAGELPRKSSDDFSLLVIGAGAAAAAGLGVFKASKNALLAWVVGISSWVFPLLLWFLISISAGVQFLGFLAAVFFPLLGMYVFAHLEGGKVPYRVLLAVVLAVCGAAIALSVSRNLQFLAETGRILGVALGLPTALLVVEYSILREQTSRSLIPMITWVLLQKLTVGRLLIVILCLALVLLSLMATSFLDSRALLGDEFQVFAPVVILLITVIGGAGLGVYAALIRNSISAETASKASFGFLGTLGLWLIVAAGALTDLSVSLSVLLIGLGAALGTISALACWRFIAR